MSEAKFEAFFNPVKSTWKQVIQCFRTNQMKRKQNFNPEVEHCQRSNHWPKLTYVYENITCTYFIFARFDMESVYHPTIIALKISKNCFIETIQKMNSHSSTSAFRSSYTYTIQKSLFFMAMILYC